ncbi:MAG: ornithine cyclodeaminase family protein [Haloferacaceae archaeon]
MVRVLSGDDVAELLSLPALLPVVEEAFVAQGRGAVERPERPHFPVGTGPGDEPSGTGLVMPAYVHGHEHYAAKVVGVHEGNADRGLPTVNATIVLVEAGTGLPAAFLAGNRITNARTGCIGGLAAREFARTPATVGLLGAGTQARWQARAIAAAVDVAAVRVYAPSDSRVECAADLAADGINAAPVDAPAAAVEEADVVVTATTSRDPVFPAGALGDGTLVVAVGAYTPAMQELPPGALDRADHVFADVPEEVAAIGDVAAAGIGRDDLVPFPAALDGSDGRPVDAGDVVVVESVGTAVLDAAAAGHLHAAAVADGVGTTVDL